MRDRLIELLKNAEKELLQRPGSSTWGDLADILIANGVIVPRVNAGQTIYRSNFISHKVIDWSIARIDIYEDEIVYCEDSFNIFTDDEIGKTVFLTKEEAVQALAERSGNELA